MLRASIILDEWKLPIFERHLSAAHYAFEKLPGVTDNTLTLIVHTTSIVDLQSVVEAANTEARKGKMQ